MWPVFTAKTLSAVFLILLIPFNIIVKTSQLCSFRWIEDLSGSVFNQTIYFHFALSMSFKPERMEKRLWGLQFGNKLHKAKAKCGAPRASFTVWLKLFLSPLPWQVPPILLDKQFSDFTPDITPIILAAHTNNYEIIKLLVQKGVSMPQPHEVGKPYVSNLWCILYLCFVVISSWKPHMSKMSAAVQKIISLGSLYPEWY